MRRFSPWRTCRRTKLLLIGLALGACSDSSGPPDGPQPAGQIIVRSQPTSATVAVPLATPIVVELQDCWDRLADTTGVEVTATVASGTGTIKSGGTTRSRNGIATFDSLVIVGRTTSPITLQISIANRNGGGKLTVKTTGPISLSPGKVAEIRANDPTTYTGGVGTAVSPAPSVVVVDAGQNPLPNQRVTFRVVQGNGRVQDSVVMTDANGLARVGSWTLGLPGLNRLAAQSENLEVQFQASASGTIGMLRLRVTGRPDGSPIPIRVLRTTIGSPAFDSTVSVTDTLTLVGIPFGTYNVSGDSINRGTRLWLPKTNYTNVNVSATSGPDLALDYLEHGRIEATVRGLPVANLIVPLAVVQQDTTNGLTGTIVARNDAVARAVLPLGRYEVVAPQVPSGGQVYAPTPQRQFMTVRSGETTPVAVQYTQSTGTLVVTVSGLPAGVTASVDVSGPGGFRETIFMSGNRVYSGLAPGTYTITASPVTAGGRTYTPNAGTQTADVTAGAQVTAAFVYTGN